MAVHEIARILDASLNRASEGLRVVEDYVRFVLDDGHLTEQLKQLRHDLAAAGSELPLADRHRVRDTEHDVGTQVTTASETQRTDAWAVCIASFERLKQSLRSLEEFAKVDSRQLGGRFEAIRYRLYTLEAAVGRTVDALQRLAEIRLYVLVDGCETEAAFQELIHAVIAGGADAIQLRDKKLSDRELVTRARLLRDRVRRSYMLKLSGPLPLEGRVGEGVSSGYTSPLIVINDRPDIAAAADADGVHLGQEDLSVKDARAALGPHKLIGVSTHSIEQARAAVIDGANYIGVGPTFPSETKAFNAFPGVALLRQVAAEIRVPAFAIGGINGGNLAKVRAAGFTRVAVSSAITSADNPAAAAQNVRAVLLS
jgi:thiamine-phosphate pyrophosphorylase